MYSTGMCNQPYILPVWQVLPPSGTYPGGDPYRFAMARVYVNGHPVGGSHVWVPKPFTAKEA
jgi:hypothetical protein